MTGFVQYIESVSVREVSDTEGSILNFFRKHNPSDSGPYGIAAETMDSYIRSCGKKGFTKPDNFQPNLIWSGLIPPSLINYRSTTF